MRDDGEYKNNQQALTQGTEASNMYVSHTHERAS